MTKIFIVEDDEIIVKAIKIALEKEFQVRSVSNFRAVKQEIMEFEADLVLNYDSNYASKNGLSELKTGLKTRYEITKRIKPFVDVAYQYEKGQKLTSLQQASNSEKGWLYGAGIEFVF